MIPVKSEAEIRTMRDGGQIAAQVLEQVLTEARPGTTTLALNELVSTSICQAGGKPAFLGFKGYPFAACFNVNDGIVHGLPCEYQLREGDLLSLDLGVYYKGLYTDTAWTVIVGRGGKPAQFGSPEKENFLSVGRKALKEAIAQCRDGKAVGDISFAIQSTVEKAGFQVVKDLVGHGVGRRLHEEPQVPGLGWRGKGLRLGKGMTLAIEVIYALGSSGTQQENDGWTIKTKDGSLAALFEHTVAVTTRHPIVLTARSGFC